MNPQHRRLTRHLVLIVLIKVAVLAAIWWAFIRDARVPVGVDEATNRIFPNLNHEERKP